LIENPEEKRPLRRPRLRWEDNIKMDLKMSRKLECGLDLFDSRYELIAGSCEHNNGSSGCMKHGEFDYLSDRQLLKKDSAPWS
jgi:hypothetical protein